MMDTTISKFGGVIKSNATRRKKLITCSFELISSHDLYAKTNKDDTLDQMLLVDVANSETNEKGQQMKLCAFTLVLW